MTGRILFCWELGGGYGHIRMIAPLARELKRRGHEVLLAAKDVAACHGFFRDTGIEVVQAPIMAERVSTPGTTLNFSDMLTRCGYHRPEPPLMALIAWRKLFEFVKPDLLVFEHAPTALLAARGSGIPTAYIGTGFTLPPATRPMPSMQPWKAIDQSRLRASDEGILRIVNAALTAAAIPTLPDIADLFHIDKRFLCTFAELDHYPSRGEAQYYGALLDHPIGMAPAVRRGNETAAFVYLVGNYPGADSAIGEIASAVDRTVVHVSGGDGEAALKIDDPSVTFSATPIDLAPTIHDFDVIVGHGGHGMSVEALLAGKPMLVLPRQAEQAQLAYRLTTMGAALTLSPGRKPGSAARAISHILTTPSFAETARAFAEKYRDDDPAAGVERIAGECEALLES